MCLLQEREIVPFEIPLIIITLEKLKLRKCQLQIHDPLHTPFPLKVCYRISNPYECINSILSSLAEQPVAVQ